MLKVYKNRNTIFNKKHISPYHQRFKKKIIRAEGSTGLTDIILDHFLFDHKQIKLSDDKRLVIKKNIVFSLYLRKNEI